MFRYYVEHLSLIRKVHNAFRIEDNIQLRSFTGKVQCINTLFKFLIVLIYLFFFPGNIFLLLDNIAVELTYFSVFAVDLFLQIPHFCIKGILVLLLFGLVVFHLCYLVVKLLLLLLQRRFTLAWLIGLCPHIPR